MNILFVTEAGESPSSYYRARLPAMGINAVGLGNHAEVCSSLVELPDGKVSGYDPVRGVYPIPDVVVCRRMNEPVEVNGHIFDSGNISSCASMFTKARRCGQRIYVDLDDDPWHLPDWNPAKGNLSDDDLALWVADMEAANGVITSTKPLADLVHEHTAARATVIRNSVDIEPYVNFRVSERTPLRLGWMGTTEYRGVDLAGIVPQLRDALAGRFGEVEFWHLGWRPEQDSVREILGDSFPVQVVERPWVDIQKLPESLSQVDCVIIPMAHHRFNASRSTATGLACMAAGKPFVASATDEYEGLWREGAGYVTETWEPAIRMLTEKPYVDARSEMRSMGIRVAATKYAPAVAASRYLGLFNAD